MLYSSVRPLLAALLAVLTLTSCRAAPASDPEDAASSDPETSISEISVIEEPPEEPAVLPEYILYTGFSDQVFTADAREFIMANDKANKVSFRFRLTDNGGNLLFESDNVAPGKSVRWDVTQRWKSGRHRLNIEMTPVSPDGEEGNVLTQHIAVEIKLK